MLKTEETGIRSFVAGRRICLLCRNIKSIRLCLGVFYIIMIISAHLSRYDRGKRLILIGKPVNSQDYHTCRCFAFRP